MTYPSFVVQDTRFLADIQNGWVFHAAVYSETVADDGSLKLFIQTNNEGEGIPHTARFRINAGGLSELRVYEAASIEAGQTGVSWFNYNRNSANTTVSTLSTVTSFSNGTVFFKALIGNASVGGSGIGGNQTQEFILADSSHYCFELTNRNGNAQPLFLALDYVDRD